MLGGGGIKIDAARDAEAVLDRCLNRFPVNGDGDQPMGGGIDAAPSRNHVTRVNRDHRGLGLRRDLPKLADAVVPHLEALLVGLPLRLTFVEGNDVGRVRETGGDGGEAVAPAQFLIERSL